MKRLTLRRLAALVLAAFLAIPAWAAPGAGWAGALQGPWGWFAGWFEGWFAKAGPCMDPEGKPVPCTPGAGPAFPGGRSGAGKSGPCMDPLGKPVPCTPGAGPAVPGGRSGAGKSGPCMDPNGKPVPCSG